MGVGRKFPHEDDLRFRFEAMSVQPDEFFDIKNNMTEVSPNFFGIDIKIQSLRMAFDERSRLL